MTSYMVAYPDWFLDSDWTSFSKTLNAKGVALTNRHFFKRNPLISYGLQWSNLDISNKILIVCCNVHARVSL